jgi:Flp pilus assembly protein TadD
MKRHASGFSVLVCFLSVFAGGCALHRPASFRDQLIKGGNPSQELGSPATATKPEDLEAYVQRVKQVAAAARPTRADEPQPSVESQSPELTADLLQLQADPSAANERKVGEAYRAVGVLDLAHRHLTRAVELDPSDARAFDALARIWRDWGFPNLAFGDASRALYYAPTSAEARNTLGTLFQALGRLPEARTAYRQALAIDPEAAYALNNLCYLSVLEGKAGAAVDECRLALRLAPGAPSTHNNLGLAYASLGELQSAHREFSAAGSAARAAYNMGMAQLSLGKYADADASFREALAADPNMYQARQRAAEALRRAARASADHQERDHDRD